MPNYTASDLAKAQGILQGRFQAGEVRYRLPATFREFVRQTEVMVPSHRQLRTREDRAVEANFFARSARTLGSARSHDHTGDKGDSAVLTPSWSVYTDEFKMSLKQADISVYSTAEQLANELQQVIGNFAEGLEDASDAYLFNNRSQVNTYAAQGTFDGTDNVFQIAEANEDRAVQIIKSAMDFNKYQGMGYTFFCDTVAYDKFEFFANQGQGNSQNLTFQYSGVNFVKSIGLDARAADSALNGTAGYTNGFVIAVPDGMIAALDWIPVQNRTGIDGKEAVYGSLINPVDGLVYATHSYDERSDETADNGQTQDVKTETQVSIDIALEHAPLTTANETPLQAFAIVTA
jgi:hypothetical protein